MKAYKIASIIYVLIGCIDVLARIFSWIEIDNYSKPLLIPILIYFLIERTEGKVYKYHLVLAGAMVFSWIGDVALMWEGETSFLIGLGAFLATHVIYVLIFKMDVDLSIKEVFSKNIFVFLALLLYGAVFLYILIPAVSVTLITPIALYSLALLLMAGTAYVRNRNLMGYKEVFMGSLLFVLSDSVLAYNQFVERFTGANAMVMATYITAQFLIVDGITRREIAK